MSLTPEQEQIISMETTRHNNNLEIEFRRSKLEAIRLAKETLIENSRSKPVDQRDISAEDIKNFAEVLITYIKND